MLVLVWPWFSELYRLILQSLGNGVREAAGLTPLRAVFAHYTYALIPGLALVLARPGGSPGLRLAFLAGILLGFLLLDILLFAFAIEFWTGRSPEGSGAGGSLFTSLIHSARVGLPVAAGAGYLLLEDSLEEP